MVVQLVKKMTLKTYSTVLEAIDPATGELVIWAGLDVQAESEKEAQRWCIENGLGYLQVVGEKIQDPSTVLALDAVYHSGNREN